MGVGQRRRRWPEMNSHMKQRFVCCTKLLVYSQGSWGWGWLQRKNIHPALQLGGPREPRALGYCDNKDRLDRFWFILRSCFPLIKKKKKESSHSSACVSSVRVVTVQSPMETLCANTSRVTCLQWGNQVTTTCASLAHQYVGDSATWNPGQGCMHVNTGDWGELSLVLMWWRREFVVVSYNHVYCSKRNLKELDEVTKREKQIWKRVFKASCLESMSQLQSSWLSAHSLPPFFFSYKRQM